MSTQIQRDIVKGNVADYAIGTASIQCCSTEELITILREIADILCQK